MKLYGSQFVLVCSSLQTRKHSGILFFRASLPLPAPYQPRALFAQSLVLGDRQTISFFSPIVQLRNYLLFFSPQCRFLFEFLLKKICVKKKWNLFDLRENNRICSFIQSIGDTVNVVGEGSERYPEGGRIHQDAFFWFCLL